MSQSEMPENIYALFEKLFLQYFEPLVAYAFRYVNDWQVAEDLVQETFLDTWILRSKIDFSQPLKPYLYRSVYNKAINHLNSFAVQKRIDPEDTDALINEIIIQSNQYDTLLVKEIQDEIQIYLNSLPPQCRNVFLLSREKQMKNREIAALLEISEKAVEKHISKALSGLRQHLGKLDLLPAFLIVFFIRHIT